MLCYELRIIRPHFIFKYVLLGGLVIDNAEKTTCRKDTLSWTWIDWEGLLLDLQTLYCVMYIEKIRWLCARFIIFLVV